MKERPCLCVLSSTDMSVVLVKLAFIDEVHDNSLLAHNQEEFAQAIDDRIFDYIGISTLNSTTDTKLIAPNGKSYEHK